MFDTIGKLATVLFPIRRVLLAASAVGLVINVVVLRMTDLFEPLVISLLSPLVTWPWGLLILAAWFHPSEGQIAKMGDFPGVNVMRIFPAILCLAFFMSPVLFYVWSQ
jgi:hypothetical protein